jgi:oligopeptide/dipeptide ABC transporter ATP-binding protein
MGGKRLKKILDVINLQKYYPLKSGDKVCAVNGINISICKGETLGLVGESGCGKTTTGKCLVKLIEPSIGQIIFEGKDINLLKNEEFRKTRKDIQIVFQDPYDSLNPRKRAKEIIEDPLIALTKTGKRERLDKVKEALEMVELNENRLYKYPIQLTQGEQQRIGVARALITNPKLVILDEPTSLLDIRFRAEIIILLKKLQQKLDMAYLFITHDLPVIYQLCHRVAIMYLGRIVEEGPTKEVFNSPQHPYTKALLGSVLLPDIDQKFDSFPLKGEVPSPINLPSDRCNLTPRCPIASEMCKKSLPHLVEISKDHYCACFRV